MAKEFNIQGGYFSPPGFLKVETGGSHDENPNGGVQIGVDEQGIPNMLEEGEPVYDDYVYSDNITADKSILEQFHLPEKYAGKLYSEIADAFVDEAEDRPLDPISNNGLRVMLGRLANAQEQQKANQEQDEIEKELADMSPEELTELEQILTAQEQNQQVGGEQIVVPEQFQPTQESLGFANGGPLRETSADAIKFADVLAKSSGNLVDDVKSIPAYYLNAHRRGEKELIDSAYPSDSKADKKSAREHVRLMLLRRADELKKSEQTKMMKDGGLLRKLECGGKINKFANGSSMFQQPAWLMEPTLDNLGTIRYKLRNNIQPDIKPLSVDRTIFGGIPLSSVPVSDRVDDNPVSGENVFPVFQTGSRYAGGIGHGILALSNSSTPETRFSSPRALPYYPTGQIALNDMVYNPLDVGMMMNQTLAQGAGTTSALRNSGLGPSTGAAIVAADRNIGRNIGDTLLSGFDANNRRRNEVIAGNNNNEAQRAEFNYNLSAARANALNEAQRENIRNGILLQRLNDAAESQKYAAISNELGYGLDALTKMGDENLALNMVNSVYPYGYRDRSGRVVYNRSSRGGILLKKFNG